MARLRAEYDRLEEFSRRQLDEFETLHRQIGQRDSINAQQRAAELEELAAARAQLSRLATVAVELADTRTELAQARVELAAQRELVARTQSASTMLEAQVAQLKQEVASLEQALAEARQQADEQRRLSAEERAGWVGQLLRSALDMQSQLLDEKQEDPSADLKVVHDEEAAPASTARMDPVLNAVMAQFEMLQRGRSNGKSNGRQGVA
jgi:chromosome segregation ATPase